jgi:uncharacterized protein YgiM (DUF1202 family)
MACYGGFGLSPPHSPPLEDIMTARLATATTLILLGGLAFGGPAWSAGIPRDTLAPERAIVRVQATGGTVTVRSKSGYANLRAEPTTKSQLVGKVNQGTKLEVVGTSGDWTQVKSGDKTGYINNKLLKR